MHSVKLLLKVSTLWILFNHFSFAEVQPYQIRRLIIYQTDCDLVEINQLVSSNSDGLAFKALCENVSFYPDGVDVVCPDQENETSCEIQTQGKSFDHLKLLQNSNEEEYDQ